ncbi:MAG: hypothetical protein ICV84_25545, partial [Flavisolibacter sp.]|nr:hypothetical protein [Flavisolibacter sp.]
MKKGFCDSGHNDKGIQDNSFFFHQKSVAVYKDVLVGIGWEQWFPSSRMAVKNCGWYSVNEGIGKDMQLFTCKGHASVVGQKTQRRLGGGEHRQGRE